jgi:hypothetical protein
MNYTRFEILVIACAQLVASIACLVTLGSLWPRLWVGRVISWAMMRAVKRQRENGPWEQQPLDP